MRRGLLRLGRALWYPFAGVLGLLGFGPRPPRRPWQPPADASHPLWQAVRERREHPGGEPRRPLPLELERRTRQGGRAADPPPAIRQLEQAIEYLERTGRRRRLRPVATLAGGVSRILWMLRPAGRPVRMLRSTPEPAVEPGLRPSPDGQHHHLSQLVEERHALREQQAAPELRTVENPARRPRPRRSSRLGGRVTVVAVSVVVLVVAVGSSAYFTGSGSGAGSASVGTAEALTFSPGTVSSLLYPDGMGDVSLTVHNPNSFAQTIHSLALDITAGTGGFDSLGCTLAQAQLTFIASASTLDNGGPGWTVGAGDTVPIDLADAISMGASDNACQGATFTVHLKVAS